ncbi:LPS-assembly protein LptD [Hydrogenimonas sp.]
MRKFFIYLAAAVTLWAADTPAPESVKVEIMAQSVEREGNRVEADGDVVVYYKDMILQARRALYDVNRSVIELYGDVTVMKGLEYGVLSDYVYLDLKKDFDLFRDYFLTGFQTQMWVRGEEAERKKDMLTLDKAFLSSCDAACPDWHIEFTSAEYNSTTKWLDVWNPKFYAGDLPIFYLPYIGTSLVHERKTGLLRPSFGISDRDGFTYEQSLYIALDPQWDLEITPQYRVNRGAGAYANFRFVDTPYSHGSIKGGYFRSRQSYVQEYNLQNSSHYGLELHYANSALFTRPGGEYDDGLYVDITYLNDPDYINLQATTGAELAGSSQVQSRINYFFNTPSNYVGLYGKYFIDTKLSSEQRRKTFQNIPTLQLHHYQTDLLGLGFLQYSADYRYNHFFTESGAHIQFQELNLPLTFYWSFFDDYLKFSLSENLYYSYSSYHNLEDVLSPEALSTLHDDYYSLFRNYHALDLYTDLARSYGENFHTLQLRVTYNKPSFSSEKGDTVDYIQVLRSPRENLIMSATNYLYDAAGKEFLYYRIAQPVLYEPLEEVEERFNRYGDLEQEVRYRFLEHYELYTDLFFSYYIHNVSAATSYFKVHYPKFDLMLNHFFKQRLDPESDYSRLKKTSDFFTLGGTYRSDAGYDYYGSLSYDNLNDKINRWGAGMRIFRHCWDLDFGIRDEIVPILSSAQKPDNIHNVTFYFTINLVPFGAYTQTIQQGL